MGLWEAHFNSATLGRGAFVRETLRNSTLLLPVHEICNAILQHLLGMSTDYSPAGSHYLPLSDVSSPALEHETRAPPLITHTAIDILPLAKTMSLAFVASVSRPSS